MRIKKEVSTLDFIKALTELLEDGKTAELLTVLKAIIKQANR